jgi:hypothetical protein
VLLVYSRGVLVLYQYTTILYVCSMIVKTFCFLNKDGHGDVCVMLLVLRDI